MMEFENELAFLEHLTTLMLNPLAWKALFERYRVHGRLSSHDFKIELTERGEPMEVEDVNPGHPKGPKSISTPVKESPFQV